MKKSPNEAYRKVGVSGKFNVAPAHLIVTRVGAGSNWPLAIYRAIKEIFKDPRIKGKRNIFPIRLTITDGSENYDEN